MGKFNKKTVTNYIKIAHLQDSLQAGISCLMIALDDMLQSDAQNKKPNLQKLATKLIDATALTGHVSKELSFKRRDALKPFLQKDFKQACSHTNKVEHMLFGNDLAAKVQQFRDANRFFQVVTNPGRNNPNASRQNFSNSRNFLSNWGRGQHLPRRNNQQFHKRTFSKA